MNNSKILFLLHLPPPIHGSSIVGKSIVDSTIINNTFNCSVINLLVSRSVDEIGKGGAIKMLRFVKVWFILLIELIFDKPNLCYFALTATGAAFYKDVLLVFFLRVFNVRIVYHLHNKGFKQAQQNKINFKLYQFVFKNADVILLSKLLYNDIDSFVKKDRVHICANGIEDQLIINNEQLIIKKKIEILFLSNLIESKGVFILLEACKLLDKKNIDFNCNFIGGEGDVSENQLNEKIKLLGLETKVKYLGKQYGADKDKYWQEADIFAFPTYYHNETFGLVNLEAMQYSLPIVSTFEGGIPDVVENGVTGYLVPQQDAQALADKLELLIKGPALRQEMGAAGRKKYEQEFTLEIFEKRMVQILQEIIEKS